MSFLTRSSVVFAIIFGCFAVIIPRIFLPLFRSRPTQHTDHHFRRPSPPVSRSNNDDMINHVSDSSPHMYHGNPHLREHHPGINDQQSLLIDQNNSKSAVTFALPMYAVGIVVFFLYTCFKYCSRQTTKDNTTKLLYSTDKIQWNSQNRKFKYQTNVRQSDDDNDEQEEDLYSGLDPDYVQYLRLRRKQEYEAQQVVTSEQRQMNYAFDEMKNSLSFINSKLKKNEMSNQLTTNDINQLQDRLAQTEAQMCKILNALDIASNKVNELTKNTRQSVEQVQQKFLDENLSSKSHSEDEESIHDEQNSNSDENSSHQEEPILTNNQEEEEESSSSYEDDEEIPNNHNDNDENESESSSERYGLMNTEYGSDPTTIDDYELNTNRKLDQTNDTRTKIQEWRQRNHSQSLSSSHSSLEQDQAIPNDEQKSSINEDFHE